MFTGMLSVNKWVTEGFSQQGRDPLDHLDRLSMALGKAEISSVVTSSHGFELHRVDEFRHVHNQSGIDEVFIPVVKIAYASIEKTTNVTLVVQNKRSRITVFREGGLLARRLFAHDHELLQYIGRVYTLATVIILDRALLLPVGIGQRPVA